MADDITRRIYRIDDQTLVQTFDDIVALFPDGARTPRYHLSDQLYYNRDDIENVGNLSGKYAYTKAYLSIELGNAKGLSIRFIRMIDKNGVPSAKFDDIIIGANNTLNTNDPLFREAYAKVLSVVSRLYFPFASEGATDTIQETLNQQILGVSAAQREMLASLNAEIANIANQRAELERKFSEKNDELLKQQHESLAKLEEERAKLELHSYKSERRKVMQSLTNAEAVGARQGLIPRGAKISRWAVFVTLILFSLLAASFSYQNFQQLGSLNDGVSRFDPVIYWLLLGKAFLSSLISLGGLVYASSWLRRFYEADIANIREIDRFNHDLIRASWVIETILEVKHEHEGEVPPQWVDGVTRGLFEKRSDKDETDPRTQALRALLGYTASMSVGPEGPKLEIGSKDAKKLSKATD